MLGRLKAPNHRTFQKLKLILEALPRSIGNNLKLVMITGIINAALEVLSVFLLSTFIEKATSNNTTLGTSHGFQGLLLNLSLYQLGIFVIVTTLLLASIRFANIRSTAIASQAVSSELGRFFVSSILRSDFETVQNINQSEVVALSAVKTLSFVKYIIFPVIQLIVSAFVIIAFLLILILYSNFWELLCLGLLGILFAGSTIYTRRKVAHSSLRISESFDKIVKILNRVIQGFREIRVSRNSESILNEYFSADSDLLNAEVSTRIYALSPKVIIEAIVIISVALFICLKSSGSGSISITGLITILLITQRTLPHIQNISYGISSMRAGRSTLEDIYLAVVKFSSNILHRGSLKSTLLHERLDNSSPYSLQRKKLSLQFSNVEFKHFKSSKNNMIAELSLELEEGDCLALLGKSGSGKTTILDLASGLLSPTKGSIYLGGSSHTSIDSIKISYVTQKPFIIDGTIKDNITLFSDPEHAISDSELIQACKNADLFSPTSQFRLNSILAENGANLSGGQLTRLSIARALISHPSLLLLDEPTAALDPMTELNIIENLKHLLRSKICIIATHRPAPLKLCNKFLLLNEGKPLFLSKKDSLEFLSSKF